MISMILHSAIYTLIFFRGTAEKVSPSNNWAELHVLCEKNQKRCQSESRNSRPDQQF